MTIISVGLTNVQLVVNKFVWNSKSKIPRQQPDRSYSEAGQSTRKFLSDFPILPSNYCRASSSKLYLQPQINSKSELYALYQEYCSQQKPCLTFPVKSDA